MAMHDPLTGALSSSAFRIAAAALAAIVVVTSAFAILFFRQSQAALTDEVLATLKADAEVIAQQSVSGGVDAAREAVQLRLPADTRRLYLLTAAGGMKIAGNLDRLPPEIAAKPAGGVFSYSRPDAQGKDGVITRQAVAVTISLPGSATLLVGRDIDAEQDLFARMRLGALSAMAILALAGLAGGYILSRAVLGRLDSVNRAARSIMAGDMTRRIPLAGSGDEIDRVAHSLNQMLDRIEQLMSGLREVSDNIAHDLKTPLNRLRNRAEAALRETDNKDACRVGLEQTIEEADELIKTFNALLLIARLEAGALEGNIEDVDIGRLVADVAELYEPVAEEAGLTLVSTVPDAARISVNRHLVGQAVANLIDNAIKYGAKPPPGNATSDTALGATRIVVAVEQQVEAVDISVSDNGPGISAPDRERVLRRFVRLEQSRSRPGTGLGLSLVAAVARLHEGRVRLEDNAPGLRVVLTLPRGKGPSRVSGAASPVASGA